MGVKYTELEQASDYSANDKAEFRMEEYDMDISENDEFSVEEYDNEDIFLDVCRVLIVILLASLLAFGVWIE